MRQTFDGGASRDRLSIGHVGKSQRRFQSWFDLGARIRCVYPAYVSDDKLRAAPIAHGARRMSNSMDFGVNAAARLCDLAGAHRSSALNTRVSLSLPARSARETNN